MSLPADEPFDDRQMLVDAIEKSRKLLAELRRQQAEIEASPPDLPPDKLAEGRRAFENAVAAAQRALTALEQAATLQAKELP